MLLMCSLLKLLLLKFLVYKSDRGTPPNGTSLLESILITGMAIGVIGDDSDIGLIDGDEMKIG